MIVLILSCLTCLLLGEAENRAASQSYSEVTILQTGVDEIELAVEMEEEGFVVLSNQYYLGWRAYVDGREERIYRANYILMTVPLAEGSHEVRFVYEPAMHQINLLVRIIVPLALVGVLLFMKYSVRRRSLALSPVEVKGPDGGRDEQRRIAI